MELHRKVPWILSKNQLKILSYLAQSLKNSRMKENTPEESYMNINLSQIFLVESPNKTVICGDGYDETKTQTRSAFSRRKHSDHRLLTYTQQLPCCWAYCDWNA